MRRYTAKLVCKSGNDLAEGPVWHTGALWWVDILKGEFHRLSPEDGVHEFRKIGGLLGAALPCVDGRWILARDRELYFYEWQSDTLENFSELSACSPRNRFNDGKCDAHGRLWIGTMNMDLKPGTASFYRLRDGRECEPVLDGITISNGLGWAPDGKTLYYIDTPTKRIDRFDFDEQRGDISNRLPLVNVKAGFPDGMAVDAEGNLWVAHWDGHAVICYHGTSGKPLAKVELPVARVSSCTFGGKNLDILYITTARNLTSNSKHQYSDYEGCVFQAHVETKGMPVHPFQVTSAFL